MKLSTTPNHTGQGHANNAALRGATLAFQKTAVKRTVTAPPANDNGALIAATSASRDHSLARSSSPSRQTTSNNGVPGRYYGAGNHRSIDLRSPSLIAATLAASRSESPSPKTAASTKSNAHKLAQRQRRGAIGGSSTGSSVTELDLVTDLRPIGPAHTIISFFEQKEAGTALAKKVAAVPSAQQRLSVGLTPPRVISPVVTYNASSSCAWVQSAPTSPSTGQDMTRPNLPLHHAERSSGGRTRPPPPPPPSARKPAHLELLVSTTSPVIDSRRRSQPTLPTPKTVFGNDTVVLSPQPRPISSQKIIKDSLAKNPEYPDHSLPQDGVQQQVSATKTATPPDGSFIDKNRERRIRVQKSSSSVSNDTFVSASSPQSKPPPRKNSGSAKPEVSRSQRPSPSPPALPSRSSTLRQNKSAPQIPLSSLTNAILAGSLASARATPSIVKSLTPPPRIPTPHLRQTLRPPRPKSDEEVYGVRPLRRTKSLIRFGARNKHAYHEGSRRRWREVITAHERQRYEAVWASNRGLLLHSLSLLAGGWQNIDTTQLVANVVVRDIWARSRLPLDELAEVWDLVDTQHKGVLDKAEFVVGMWLIDQRLRGRKIPRKVSESVWGSARGVRVQGPKKKKR